jgi:heme-degrading monooxygenase HmoA
MQKLTFIVPFEVPEGQETEMRALWHARAERLSHAPGFLSARLYEINSEVEAYLRQNVPGLAWVGEDRFRFVNIAQWASLEQYEAAIRSTGEQKPIAFPSYPAYYRLASGIINTVEPASTEHSRTGQEFTFIIPFEVPEGQEEEMRRQFRAVVEGMGRVEGSFGPGLYELDGDVEKHLRGFLVEQEGQGGDIRETFRFINVAEWASVAHYEATMRSRRQVQPITFTGHGAYYRVVGEYSGSQAE